MICAWTETSTADTGSSATMKAGSTDERPGDADALALPAAEVARMAIGMVWRRGRRGRAARARVVDLSRAGRADGRRAPRRSIWRTVMRGLSEE